MQPDIGTQWDRESDLVVAGAGAGGMTAALVASLEGLDVLVCESSQQVGGTSATSAGTIWIPGNRQSIAAGFADSAESAFTYLRALVGPRADNAVVKAYLAQGPDAVDYLRERSAVEFVPSGKHPDYRMLPGAALTGRALAPAPFDGRLLGKAFARVRPPIREFLLFGGMMVGKEDIPKLINRFAHPRNLLHAAKLFARFSIDRLRYPRGTRVTMGNALVARLFYSLRQRDVPVLFGARVRELVSDGARVVGALVEQDGKTLRIRARLGVVLATGGLGHNRELRERFMPQPVPAHSLANETDVGDGLVMAERAGAALASYPPCGLWTPASITTHHADRRSGLYPHLALDRAKPGIIAVNAAGRRFVDEGVSYHDFVEAMFAANANVPTIPAHLVCDSRFIAKYGLGAIFPSVRDLARFERCGYLVKAATLDELAAKLRIDAGGLRETVARFNVHAAQGEDPEFGKGRSELCRFNGDATHTPNPCLAPLDEPPFYAVTVWPAEIATSSGIAANEHAQALDASGNVIAGLYTCGNDMASVMQGSYPGPGTTLGPALNIVSFGAMHAARAKRTATMDEPVASAR